MSAQDNLENRYRRLLRFYPKEYRAARGEEIVGTYMESAPPGRSKPGLADVGDIAAAGLRQRLRHVPEGLPGGLRLAAIVAFSFATASALCYTLGPELSDPNISPNPSAFGPFTSPAVTMWALWIALGVAAAFLPGKITRIALSVPLLATLATVPLAYVTHSTGPIPSLLAPQFALGLVALAWPANPGKFARFAPMLAMPVGLVAMVASAFVQPYIGAYTDVAEPAARLALVVMAVIMVHLVVSDRYRGEGGFAAAALAIPASVFAIGPVLGLLAFTSDSHRDYQSATTMIATVAACAIVGLAVPIASYAVAARRNQLTHR